MAISCGLSSTTSSGRWHRGQWPDQEGSHCSDLVSAGLEALDLLDIGVGVVNDLGRLLFANQSAQQILATRDGLEVTAQGVLSTLKGCCTPPLSAFLQQAAHARPPGTSGPRDTALAVRRPSGRRPLTLLVRSLHGTVSNSVATEPAALVFVLDPELPVQATESRLRQLYGFTSSEARLAQLVMSGKTFEECCEQLDIRPSTARMHLGNMFAKTGVRRQGQLISLLLKSLGTVRTTSAHRNMGQGEPYADCQLLHLSDKPPNRGAPKALTAGLEALDLLDIGVGVVNDLGRLLFANQSALQILATRDGLEVTAQGVLGALKGCCTPPLSALLQQAAHARLAGTSGPRDTALAVRRPSGKRPLTLLVRSLHGTVSKSVATEPAALVFVLDPDLPVQATESRLRQLYGFTSSEARLARLLMEGNALDDCCEPLKIRASTARRHLANMFAKAGVQHQGRLICLLLKSVGIVRVQDDESSSRPVPPQMVLVRNSPLTRLPRA